MKNRSIVSAFCMALVLTTGAWASGTFSLITTNGAAGAFSQFIETHTRKGLIEWYRKSLRCDKPGQMLYTIPNHTEYGTRCHEDSVVHVVSGGVNYGLIERFKLDGIPIDWLRSELAKPETLKAVYTLIGAETIAEVVALSIGGPYGAGFVYKHSETTSGLDYSELRDSAAEFLRGFVMRRISEAKPKDRPEIARIWGEIINEQVDHLLVDKSIVVPEIRTRRK